MVPAEGPHLVPCFGAALLSGTRRSHFWGRPVGSKMGPDPAPEFMFFSVQKRNHRHSGCRSCFGFQNEVAI